jgi:hypothetical protein
MKCKFNLVVGILCFLMALVHFMIGFHDGFTGQVKFHIYLTSVLSGINFWFFVRNNRSSDRVA